MVTRALGRVISKLMTTSNLRILALLAAFAMPNIGDTSEPRYWREVLKDNRLDLESFGTFVILQDDFLYLGFRVPEADPSETDFVFLTRFKDEMDSIFSDLCKESSLALKDNNQYQFTFSKNRIVQDKWHIFIATIERSVILNEINSVCR